MNDFEKLLSALAGVPVLRSARCRGHHATFDPPGDGEAADTAAARHAQALTICSACPALEPCRAWVEGLPNKQKPSGVVAGQIRNPPNQRVRKKSA